MIWNIDTNHIHTCINAIYDHIEKDYSIDYIICQVIITPKLGAGILSSLGGGGLS